MSDPGPAVAEAPVAAPAALDDAAFAALMALLGPFECTPELAVAVSGGPDSMALCLLAQCWVRARRGCLTALIVDHGLRLESAAEARQVETWLDQRGIRYQVLTWPGPKPATGIQAAARSARYALLGDWCRAHGVLHLLVGHHRDDQLETQLLRAARRSGPDGLAGMAPVREITGLRLLRPLLSVPKQRLIATLRAAAQPWIDDPSNHALRFARARLRRAGAGADSASKEPEQSYARTRAALDRRTAAWLAAVARIDPAGFVTWPRRALAQAPPEIVRRVLQQALAAVGGNPYPPRSARLDRLLAGLAEPRRSGRTLAGCRIVFLGPDVLVCREPAAIAAPMPLEPNRWQRWDRRFDVHLRRDAGPAPSLIVRALGAEGWRQCKQRPHGALHSLPAAVRSGLPSVWRDDQLLAVVRLGALDPAATRPSIRFRFRPDRPLAGAPFAVSCAAESAEPYPWIADNHTFAST